MDDSLLQEQYDYVYNLDEDIKKSLKMYTSERLGYYRKINDYLRGNIVTLESSLHKIIEDIDEAFLNIPPISFPIILYRGNTTQIINNKSYQSCSSDLDVAKQFTKDRNCCIYILTISSGCKVLPLVSISDHPHESEFVLDRGGDYKVTNSLIENGVMNIFVTLNPPTSYNITENEDIIKIEKDKIYDRIIAHTKESLDELIESGIIEDVNQQDIIEEIKNVFLKYYQKDPSANEITILMKKYDSL